MAGDARQAPEPVLEVRSLAFTRESAGEAPFQVEVPSLGVSAGAMVGLAGPSGCGKSTLLDVLALLRRPSRCDKFSLLGEDVLEQWHNGGVESCTRLRASTMGVVLQTGGLIPSLSVLDNILLPQRLLGREDPGRAGRLLEALDLLGLEGRLPSQLSVGQRQRVAVGRALAHRPRVVLADEPTAALGPTHAPEVMRLLVEICQSELVACVVVSHDRELLQRFGAQVHELVATPLGTRLQGPR